MVQCTKRLWFYQPWNDEKDIFVHYSQIQDTGYRTLNEGEKVEFDLVSTERGEQARHVVKID